MNSPNGNPDDASTSGDLSGRQLGDFRLLRRLGSGAMAEVYLAEQASLKRTVAVKVLRPELADDPTYLKRFQREAQAAASLVHANIVQIYEVGHVDRLHFIAQEYVEGHNLKQWLARRAPPDLPHAISIMRQVAAALAKAAEQGVVHRDIKPENIMLTRSGEVKVADFGLARVTRAGDAPELTQAGITLGTPLYMSPEQVEGRALDPRSDVYSFGVTCYQMLAGSPPFLSETALGVAVQHLKTEPKPLESLRPDLPPALCRMVHQMLAKDPDRRCRSAQEVLAQLYRLHLDHADTWPEDLPSWEMVGVETVVDQRVEATGRLAAIMRSEPSRKSGQRKRLILAIGILAAFGVGGALAWFTMREPSLLAGAEVASSLPKRSTAVQQYLMASRIGTAEAWQSVIDYYPEKHVAHRAEQQLARIYLQRGEYDRALAIFDKCAASAASDSALRAFGLAGRCGILTLQGKYRQSAEVLDELLPLRAHLDPEMGRLVNRAIQKNRSQLGVQSGRQWDEWLAEQFREDDASD